MQIERAVTGHYAVGNNTVPTGLTEHERQQVDQAVNVVNKSLSIEGRQMKQEMDKNDFLTLLVTQLKNQDPSAPMEDKQFIAQMAQFSTLEQMNNMTAEFQKLASLLSAGSAFNVLGRTVDIERGDQTISGTVSEVTNGQFPQVLVNGVYYDYAEIARVKQD